MSAFDTGFMTEQLYYILTKACKEASTEDFKYDVGYQDNISNRLNIAVKHADEGTLYFYTLDINYLT